ncbi:MAG: hypothetical protein ACRDWT_15455 [Jatrophihabitantaceae bacterium]
MNDFENRLRDHLADQARQAPNGDALAEQIIARLDHADVTPIDRHRQWRTWTFPLIAAAAVAAVALALVGVGHLGRTPSHPVAAHTSIRPAPTHMHSPTPSTTALSPTVTAAPETVAAQNGTQLLSNVHVLDLSFVGNDDGWALATADCLGVSSAPACTAMLRTTNGGTTWRGMPTPPVNVLTSAGCAAPCIAHIRFANDQIGYAFGPSALFMTRNGGASWTKQPGGADALETLDGNVIRLVSDHSGCPGPCNLRVETAPIGSSTWTSGTLDTQVVNASGVSLTRSGPNAIVETSTGQAASLYGVTLYSSSNDGRTWTKHADPCSTTGAAAAGVPMASTSVAAAGDGSISILCQPGGQGGTGVSLTSTDGGATFAAGRVHMFGRGAGDLGAASANVLVVLSDPLSRSVDGGKSWQQIKGPSLASTVTFVGFESDTVGRIATNAGRTIWTTQDAGATWTAHTFG